MFSSLNAILKFSPAAIVGILIGLALNTWLQPEPQGTQLLMVICVGVSILVWAIVKPFLPVGKDKKAS